jgi:hypothetical protein
MMKSKTLKLTAIAFLTACALYVCLLGGTTSSDTNDQLASTGHGSPETLQANYEEWKTKYLSDGGDRNWVLPMGWFKGLSTQETKANGLATINLVDGTVSVKVNGLPQGRGWDVWLIDNGAGSVLPENTDKLLRIGSLKHDGDLATLQADLGSGAFADFELDLIAVSSSETTPIENRVVVGTTTLFHRLYRSEQRGQFGVLADQDEPAPVVARHRTLFERLVDAISPTAQAQIGPQQGVNNLITRGRQGFFNQTFNGNGRTCGTCHRENESLTITPEFIATLPQDDPLFVAETQPALAQNFENPVLMRKFGLILENLDGFNDLANKFVMRGVPHTLAMLPNTLAPRSQLVLSVGIDTTAVPPNERTGWSGDGAPGTGTLREFITGAITQHYPRTLGRRIGIDFRLPTVAELDEFEAFQKSTGRRADLVTFGPGALSLKNEVAARGQVIFNTPGTIPLISNESNAGAGKCFACHNNAGGGDGIEARFFGVPNNLTTNLNFNTGVENQPSRPQKLVVPAQKVPRDGGFGQTPNGDGQGGFGGGTFNTPVLVEAADTGPFFHDNSVDTIEAAVAFYNTNSFNNSPAGQIVGGITLEATEIAAIATFLRVINALENVRSARDLAVRARNSTDRAIVNELLRIAVAEAADALNVLRCANLHFSGQEVLGQSIIAFTGAQLISDRTLRNVAINAGIVALDAARNDMRH